MKAFLKNIFEYNHTVNQKLWQALYDNSGNITDKSLKLYSHILNAHQIWNNRTEHRHAPFGVWQTHELITCREIDNDNHSHTLDLIARIDLTIPMPYTMRGKTVNKTPADILFHVINHATYHRAQIATEFRQAGIEPLATDFILYEPRDV